MIAVTVDGKQTPWSMKRENQLHLLEMFRSSKNWATLSSTMDFPGHLLQTEDADCTKSVLPVFVEIVNEGTLTTMLWSHLKSQQRYLDKRTIFPVLRLREKILLMEDGDLLCLLRLSLFTLYQPLVDLILEPCLYRSLQNLLSFRKYCCYSVKEDAAMPISVGYELTCEDELRLYVRRLIGLHWILRELEMMQPNLIVGSLDMKKLLFAYLYAIQSGSAEKNVIAKYKDFLRALDTSRPYKQYIDDVTMSFFSPLDQDHRSSVSFIPQDDLYHGSLVVQDDLYHGSFVVGKMRLCDGGIFRHDSDVRLHIKDDGIFLSTAKPCFTIAISLVKEGKKSPLFEDILHDI
jgi:hypothetical protein